MRENGAVIRISGERAAVRIRHQRSPACGACRACRPITEGEFLLWVDAADLSEGDEVTVEVPLPSPWRAILVIFAIPLAGLVGGLVLGSQWQAFQGMLGLGPQGAAAVLGGSLAVAAFFAAMLQERRFQRRHRPYVVSVHHTP